ncbi:MAG: hypothetical protein AMK73_04635 [Planctomycetes bacterium SM23_32]|nr:MAG: hypothetical protein AMK73_04635 [Planctomycetes bacterium SM23_32]
MNARENYLEAIRFGSPHWVPLGCEPLWHTLQFEGIFRCGDWTDAWGVRWEVGIEGTVPFPRGNPLADLARLREYGFPDPDEPVFTGRMVEELAGVDRAEKLVIGSLTYLLFERAWAVMGMERFLTALVTHPEAVHEFLRGIADYARRVFDRYLALGVDGVSFSEDLGTQRALMVSPAMFREFLLPEYAHCFQNVLAAGKIVHFHSCGCVDAARTR